MKALFGFAAIVMTFGLALAAGAAEVAIPPAPVAWVTDTTGLLNPSTVDTLDRRLEAYESTTGHQVLVYVTPTTGDAPTEEWTSRAFARWKVGRKGIDDGLVLFVFPHDRKARIEVGYGLEQSVPDAIASRIIRETIAPQIAAGKPDAAVTGGVDALLAAVGGETVPPAVVATPEPVVADDDAQSPFAVALGVAIALAIVIAIFWLISKLPRVRGPYLGGGHSGFGWGDAFAIGSGLLLGGGIGGGSSGGGFSGGGGAGGGGGATGSW